MHQFTNKFNVTRANNKSQLAAWRLLGGLLTILAVCLTLSGNSQQAFADPHTPPQGAPEIVSFTAIPDFAGGWILSGEVAQHTGTSTAINFGGYLSGESTTTDDAGFFTYFVFGAPSGVTVTATATTIYGTSNTESVKLQL